MFARESRAALAALTFLTRIPTGVELDADDVRHAAAYFPAVGAALGALSGAAARRAGAPAALALTTLITGALHLDALADSADALGTADRDRALEIMRDSRIGSFGTAAMCLDLLVKSAALGQCPDPVRSAAGAGALSRAVPVVLSATLPYARTSGTAQPLSEGGIGRALIAVATAAMISRDPRAIGIAAAVGACSGLFWRHRVGGVTGDTLGASLELTETAILCWGTR